MIPQKRKKLVIIGRIYVHKCKEADRKRWVHEYLAALRKEHNLSHKEKLVNQYQRCGHDKSRRE